MAELVGECQKLHSRGENADGLVSFLHARGCSKVQSIAILTKALGLGLASAKEIVHNSNVWLDAKERDERFHESLEQAMKSKMTPIPPFKLEPVPLTADAEELPRFRWAAPDVGRRHQLGGTPNFILDKEYPACHQCQEQMTFYAQLDSINEEINLADCGMIYVFVCFDCFESTSFIQSM